ncbi:ATP-binding protein [Shewanella algae]|uniref:ATP-binding protein n=1 Tax=Shewanella algae TaxID=38313 RepID=UPI0037351AC9
MKRLFISLYLLISLSFLGLGWTLDALWQQHDDEAELLADAPLMAMAAMLKPMPPEQRQQAIAAANVNATYPLRLFSADKITLADDGELAPGEVFTTLTNSGKQMQFIRLDQQVLMTGPIDTDPRASLRGLFTLFFYLSLAGVALVWVWPLSRDLKVLKQATQALGQAKWDTRIKLSPRSQVKPLAHTFNEMARHIGALIDNQRHLANAVSHEIRTPLARLKFALALIPNYCREGADEAARADFIAGMTEDVKEMESLLQEMLTYASLESAQTGLRQESCDLTALCRQVIDRLQSLSPIPITLDSSVAKLPFTCEPALIERALQNLLTNAQRFAESQIMVTLNEEKDRVTIEVKDDGEGIPEEEQHKIFEPFVRSDTSRNSNKGFGLGLAIIKRIVERHHGEILLFSRPGETRFCISLPKREFNRD